MSLVELLVAMGIFSVVIAVFMSGVVSMTRTTARAQGVSDATTSARKVLDLFDKQARYSTAVNSPGFGASGAYYYVEYLAPAQDAEAKSFCAQWRYDPTGHTMSNRLWTEPATPPSAWSLMATNVRNDAATNPPFVFTFASGPPVTGSDPPELRRQQLKVTLDIGSGTQAGAQVSTTYVARNTSVNTQSNVDANGDHVSDSPVCQSGVVRQ